MREIFLPSSLTWTGLGEGDPTSREFCLFIPSLEFLDCGREGPDEFLLTLRKFEFDLIFFSSFDSLNLEVKN